MPTNLRGAFDLPKPHRIVRRGQRIGTIKPGEFVAIDGDHETGDQITVPSGAMLFGLNSSVIRFTCTRSSGTPTMIRVENGGRVSGLQLDAKHGATLKVYGIDPRGSGNKVDHVYWTNRMARFITGATKHGKLTITNCGDDAVLGGARGKASDVYGIYLTTGSGPWIIKNVNIVVHSNFAMRAMMAQGHCSIKDSYFGAIRPFGRLFAVRGTQPRDSSVTIEDTVFQGSDRPYVAGGVGAQVEFGGDTTTDGIEQTCRWLVARDCTFDRIRMISVVGCPLTGPSELGGGNFLFERWTLTNHQSSQAISFAKSPKTLVKPKGAIRTLHATGTATKKVTSLGSLNSGIKCSDVWLNGKKVA